MGTNKNLGFTIVETLIVLVVSSLMAVSAILLINGRQNQTQFQVALGDAKQQFQQLINETASGYFPNAGNFTCTIDSATHAPVIDTSGTTSQGQNNGCVFLGKVLQLGITQGSDQAIGVYPMAGNAAGTNVLGLFTNGGAEPVPVVPLRAYQTFQFGLTPVCMRYAAVGTPSCASGVGSGTDTGGIGFLAGDNSGNFATPDTSASGGGYKSGSQQLSLYAVDGGVSTSLSTTEPSMQGYLAAPDGSNLVHASAVAICLASGGTNQSGQFIIGGSGGLDVSLVKVYEDTTC